MTQQVTTELLPCPFCESTAIVIAGNGKNVSARCGFCFASGPLKDVRSHAYNGWNTRTDREATLREALELLNRWQTWACGQRGLSPFQDARDFLARAALTQETPDVR